MVIYHAVTIYLKLNSSMSAQTPQGSFWSENFLKVSCIATHLVSIKTVLDYYDSINRTLIAINFVMQTLEVSRMPSSLEKGWNYLQRYLLMQDVLESC